MHPGFAKLSYKGVLVSSEARHTDFQVISPAIMGGVYSEAELLGTAVWLWMHSDFHRKMSLHYLASYLLPAIKHGQFVMIAEEGRALAYLSWAFFDEKTEQYFLETAGSKMSVESWLCGERMWLVDIMAPFGHLKPFSNIVRSSVLQNNIARFLYHRGIRKGICIKEIHGNQISSRQARKWFKENPPKWPKNRKIRYIGSATS